MRLKNTEKIRYISAAASVCLMASFFIIRAAISGITYDEAFTYLAYARPLEDCPTMGMVENIYWECVANNHWLNTVLIALTGMVTGIEYSEFLIRLPSILLGCCYLAVTFGCYYRKKINGAEFILLTFCYYMHEFFGLARGYGMAAALVLFGILLYREWTRSGCNKHLLLLTSTGLLLLSAYANSVTLVVCFCLGIVMLYHLLVQKKILNCDLGIACILYFICLLAMDAVFKRGGFYGRTLLPAYPLVSMGIYQLLSQAWQEWHIRHPLIPAPALHIVMIIFTLSIVLSYLGKIDLLRTRDWYDDYSIKIDFYNNPEFETNQDHASVVFYEEKKVWDLENLFEEYHGEEMNSYQLQ